MRGQLDRETLLFRGEGVEKCSQRTNVLGKLNVALSLRARATIRATDATDANELRKPIKKRKSERGAARTNEGTPERGQEIKREH